ncbi:LysM domain/BON superfamily protein [Symmachiella dynata]|uniref:LysM peptidoglycan-binding domain-containing protein n=1 Tax=Symmachiella dynata TaxID=2527995 RepID=UPI00118B85BA|nr:LysM domain-containing protein [Symmachiella dynata]QDT48134.1 LysM domain/BON superfamily protein [Symmachiella dynata]
MTDDNQRQDADERPDEDMDFEMDDDQSTSAAADWGLKKPKSGIGKEIKIGGAILLLICGIFCYVLYKKSTDGIPEVAVEGKQKTDEETPPVAKGSGIVQASRTIPPEETSQDPANTVAGAPGEFPASNSRPAARQPAAYAANPPAQNHQQPPEDDYDLMAEADALADERNASTGLLENDEWETDPAAGQLSDNTDLAAETYNEFPPAQNFPPSQTEEFPEPSADEITSLDDTTNPYEVTDNDSEITSLDDDSSTFADPAAEQFTQDETQLDEFSSQEFAESTEFSGDQEFANEQEFAETSEFSDTQQFVDEPAMGNQEPLVGELEESTEEFGELAEPQVAEMNDYRTPVNEELGGQLEEMTETDFGEPQQADPRAGEFQNVTQHTGQASSTTMVQRTDESPLEPEASFDNQAPVQDRVNGYHAVGSYQNEIESTNRAAAPDQFTVEESELDEQGYVGSTDVDPPVSQDNQTYGFDQRQQVEETFDTPVSNNNPSYVVESNDSFWSIARQTYGDPKYFQALAKYNERTIPNPKAMRPGIEIATPTAAELEQLYPELLGKVEQASRHVPAVETPIASGDFLEDEEFRGRVGYGTGETISRAAANASGYSIARDGRPQYRVSSGDNLGTIARRHLGKASRWEEIYRLNQDRLADPNRLKIGTVLRLPDDARQEAVVNRPTYSR